VGYLWLIRCGANHARTEPPQKIGIDLSGYTAGGWRFRIDHDGKAATFRPIVNPNPENGRHSAGIHSHGDGAARAEEHGGLPEGF